MLLYFMFAHRHKDVDAFLVRYAGQWVGQDGGTMHLHFVGSFEEIHCRTRCIHGQTRSQLLPIVHNPKQDQSGTIVFLIHSLSLWQ